MQFSGRLSQGGGRFHRDDPVTFCRQMGGVAPGTGPDIKNVASVRRQQIQDGLMRLLEAATFVANEKLGRLLRAAGCPFYVAGHSCGQIGTEPRTTVRFKIRIWASMS